jgi:DNA polymerase elongation subunit (family B)
MKILHIDIETAPHKVYTWGLWGQDISTKNIIEAGYTMCWAAKWDGKREVMFDSVHESKPEKMIKNVYDLLSQADAVVHYNGAKFDMPTLQKEFFMLGLPPLDYKQIDLLKVARRKFKFASNKLDYICQQLNLGSKVKHMGMELWKDCMDGDEKAWKIMKKYNKQDVVIMERLYHNMLAWIDAHPNRGLYIDSNDPVCRNCGSKDLMKNGKKMTNTGVYQRFQCKGCGKITRSRQQMEKHEGVTV